MKLFLIGLLFLSACATDEVPMKIRILEAVQKDQQDQIQDLYNADASLRAKEAREKSPTRCWTVHEDGVEDYMPLLCCPKEGPQVLVHDEFGWACQKPKKKLLSSGSKNHLQ
jgi:hypothetical protein